MADAVILILRYNQGEGRSDNREQLGGSMLGMFYKSEMIDSTFGSIDNIGRYVDDHCYNF